MIPKLGAIPLPHSAPSETPPSPQPPPAPPAPTMNRVPATTTRPAATPEGQVRRAEMQNVPPRNFEDDYWAAQPPAVQALRHIDDLEERQKLAGELLGAGYKLDIPIMVWGWGAQNTTQSRQAYGYTWVPHAMQAAIRIAPGLTMPGVEPYDPNNPPPDSILVENPQATPSWFSGGETEAILESSNGEKSSMPVQLLSTGEQALAVKQRLAELGLGDLPLSEQPPAKGYKVDWGSEPRRVYAAGGINISLWMDTLARNAKADELRALLKEAWHAGRKD